MGISLAFAFSGSGEDVLSPSRKESIEHRSLVLSKPPHNLVLWGTGPALGFKTRLCLSLAGKPRAISTSLYYSFLSVKWGNSCSFTDGCEAYTEISIWHSAWHIGIME